MADMNEQDPFELDDLFAAAKDTTPVPSDDLMARIMADAAAVADARNVPVPEAKPGMISMMLEALGGWKPAAGLAMAGVTGLMIGFVTPETWDSLSSGTLLTTSAGVDELVPSFSDFLSEG